LCDSDIATGADWEIVNETTSKGDALIRQRA
jgi:hypothetical protein